MKNENSLKNLKNSSKILVELSDYFCLSNLVKVVRGHSKEDLDEAEKEKHFQKLLKVGSAVGYGNVSIIDQKIFDKKNNSNLNVTFFVLSFLESGTEAQEESDRRAKTGLKFILSKMEKYLD